MISQIPLNTVAWQFDYRTECMNIARAIDYEIIDVPLHLSTDSLTSINLKLKELFKILVGLCKTRELSHKRDSITSFINKRCDNLLANPKLMIDSILQRRRRCIVLDRILISDPSSSTQTLVVDPTEICTHTNHHFQTIAGGSHTPVALNTRWSAQYQPLDHIDE
jgi:hypothetical protein